MTAYTRGHYAKGGIIPSPDGFQITLALEECVLQPEPMLRGEFVCVRADEPHLQAKHPRTLRSD